jgi:two-component system chemotaxis response regulator CheB
MQQTETKRSIEGTCPECRGPLSEHRIDTLVEYKCLVGHTYSPLSLLRAHSEAQEKALWAAVVALEEATNLVQALAPQLKPAVLQKLETQAAEKTQQAREIRNILARLDPFQIE